MVEREAIVRLKFENDALRVKINEAKQAVRAAEIANGKCKRVVFYVCGT